jgi:FAD binding domain/Berberine and berberine like
MCRDLPGRDDAAMTEILELHESTFPELDLTALRELLEGDVVGPDDSGWDEARLAWNLAVDQRPAAVAFPESADDVAAIVAFARANGLRVAPQGTGHGAAALGDLSDTVLLKTERMRGVTIDPLARTARVEAGTIWIEVVEAAAEHGLGALAGSSPDVGVVGYTLGGGLSWLSRKHGIGANQVTAAEVVTAAGELVRTDWANEPDLFWALRGGGGAFGIVTAIEFNLFPIEEVYAGILWYPVERAAEVLKTWRAWTVDLPDEMSSVGRILQFPPIPQIPEHVRGKSFVVVEAIWLGEPAEGARLLEPLGALGPVLDTVATMPIASLSKLHMDPEQPVPGAGDGGMLADVDDELIDRLIDHVVGSPLLSAELRHLGGAVARRSSQHGAIDAWEAPYSMYALGMAPTPEHRQAVEATVGALRQALAPWEAEHTYMNFAEKQRSAATLFSSASYHRLRRIKAIVDPTDLIRSNHPVPAAQEGGR